MIRIETTVGNTHIRLVLCPANLHIVHVHLPVQMRKQYSAQYKFVINEDFRNMYVFMCRSLLDGFDLLLITFKLSIVLING